MKSPDPEVASAAAPPAAETDSTEALRSVAAAVTEVSSLPGVALRVMQVAGDPKAGAADLKAVIEADPSLCVRVLRCLNSASFGLRNEVADLNQAVAYLGLRQIRDLAITATVSELFRRSEPVHTYQRSELWRHLVAVAICARMIGVRTRMAGFEEAFLAGLLHDLGIILFDQYRHEDFRRVILGLSTSHTLPEFERRVVGWDHTQLGKVVGDHWKLPEAPVAAIRFHHEPQLYEGPHREVVHCVSIANLICSLRDLTSVGMNLVRLSRESLDVLEIRKSDLKILAEDLGAELEANQYLFDLQKG